MASQMHVQIERSMLDDMEQMSKDLSRMSEEATRRGSYFSSQSFQDAKEGYTYRSVTVYSSEPNFLQPHSQQPGLLAVYAPAIVIGLYVAGILQFLRNFSKTRFIDEKKWMLAVLWPFLYMFSERFRNEFNHAGLKTDSQLSK
eukprot:CAMPEP_0196579338 /NCGR_PEP_ID=MMETSP1081-20130531/20397_1 /TAXON_ID=36882 /ORGANISM="Pyramimonas amylifera, Strain CCMP720" /LENGTH=142 /DNA_ID=CAMNT_0041898885 /DNA_START=417 /DNA_END=845 /DNA_ORIENTATION=-